MRDILTYILKVSSLTIMLCGLSLPTMAKEKSGDETLRKPFYGIYVDYDLGDVAMSFITSSRFGMNASIEADLWHTLYPVFEFGYENYDGAQDYSYKENSVQNLKNKVDGWYYKVGLNFNILSKDYSEYCISQGYVGFRYAFCPKLNYEIDGFTINNEYWNINDCAVDYVSGKTSARWGEFVAGVKTPIYKGFCLGVEVRFKQFLKIKEDEKDAYIIHQSYAPGFGDKEDGKWGFRYTISYFFH